MMTIIKMFFSLVGAVLKIIWRIVKYLSTPMWESIKDFHKTCWKLYKERKAQKATCADNSAERESLSAEGASESRDNTGDETIDNNA